MKVRVVGSAIKMVSRCQEKGLEELEFSGRIESIQTAASLR